MKTCPTTGKRCYDSERLAKRLMRTAHNRIRVYRCEFCHCLHVTSKAER